jgi:hypothetical protein
MPAKNKLSDLRDHLFESIEKLRDETLTEEEFQKEVRRAGALSNLSKTIIDSAKLELRAIEVLGSEVECAFLEKKPKPAPMLPHIVSKAGVK